MQSNVVSIPSTILVEQAFSTTVEMDSKESIFSKVVLRKYGYILTPGSNAQFDIETSESFHELVGLSNPLLGIAVDCYNVGGRNWRVIVKNTLSNHSIRLKIGAPVAKVK